MADELTNGAEPGDSTVLDEGQHNENPLNDAAFNAKDEPKHDEPKPDAKPEKLSARQAIEKALDDTEAKTKKEGEDEKLAKEKAEADKDAKPVDAKAEKPAKDDVAEQDKAAKAEKGAAPAKDDAAGQDGEKSRQSEGRHEPPARFLPKAKEVWANTPNPVKAEVARMAQEHEAEVKEYKQFREELREYEELGKRHNVTIKQTLDRYVAADRLLHQDFGKGIAGLAKSYGYQPLQAVSSVLQAYGVTPQQFAQYVTQNPDAIKQQAQPQQAPQQRQQPQSNEEIQALKAEISAMRQEQTSRDIIEPFKANHPRYDELEDDMIFFLKSGKIPASLSPVERLEAAYDMAERINPRSASSATVAEPEPSAQQEPVVDPRGQKSIKGAPTGGKDPAHKRMKSNRDAASAALAQLGI